jgi:hypothetical protein
VAGRLRAAGRWRKWLRLRALRSPIPPAHFTPNFTISHSHPHSPLASHLWRVDVASRKLDRIRIVLVHSRHGHVSRPQPVPRNLEHRRRLGRPTPVHARLGQAVQARPRAAVPSARAELCVKVGEGLWPDGLGPVEGGLPVGEAERAKVLRLATAGGQRVAKVGRGGDDHVGRVQPRDALRGIQRGGVEELRVKWGGVELIPRGWEQKEGRRRRGLACGRREE